MEKQVVGTEKQMISPQYLYDHPERFGGIMSFGKRSGHPDYPVILFRLMKQIFPDFPRKLASSMLGYIVMTEDHKPTIYFGKDVAELIEIPEEIFEELKEIYIDNLRKNEKKKK